jgi:flagellar hook-basal body complex protein FliE
VKINPGLTPQLQKIAESAVSGGKGLSPSDQEGQGAFSDMLSGVLSSTNSQMKSADVQSQALLSGENKNIHEVMIALEKANISFRFINQVRNKAVEAYQEVFRMQM